MIKGLDVSEDQGVIDWKQVAGAGFQFAFIKATDGLPTAKDSGVEPFYVSNTQGARAAGLIIYPYHFFRPMEDGATQANHFLDVTRNPDSMMLDIEYIGGTISVEEWAAISPDVRVARVQAFLARMKETGITVIIYTTRCFIEELLPNCKWLADYPLCISHPGQPGALPKPWTDWYYWQDPSAGRIPGINGPVDLDYLNDGTPV